MQYRESQVRVEGKKGTFESNYGGIGLGYLMPDGNVYVSGGNGWYYDQRQGMGGLKRFVQDDGREYMERAAGVLGASRTKAWTRAINRRTR
jgi:hypothetical protein